MNQSNTNIPIYNIVGGGDLTMRKTTWEDADNSKLAQSIITFWNSDDDSDDNSWENKGNFSNDPNRCFGDSWDL